MQSEIKSLKDNAIEQDQKFENQEKLIQICEKFSDCDVQELAKVGENLKLTLLEKEQDMKEL